MTSDEALSFIQQHGVVLVSAKGPVPRMTDFVAGEPVKGGWWSHPKGRDIFRVLQDLEHSPDVLVCRLVGGKVTLVHRRLWPALIRAVNHFPTPDLARTAQEHTKAGHHVRHDTPFPDWADAESLAAAQALTEDEALAALGPWTSARA